MMLSAMNQPAGRRRLAVAALLVTLTVALSACLLTPGRFTSALDLRRDGRFTFTYTGEIRMLALTKLAQMGNKPKVFEPEPCYTDGAEKRSCTPGEIFQQRKDYEAQAKTREADKRKESEQVKALLGGIDPSDPKAAEDMAVRLRRQAGWKSVVYKGDGLFEVDFAISGRLDHDFVFPTVERLPMANAFVQLTRRNDGAVRIDAPGFSAASGGGNPMGIAMMGLAGIAASGRDGTGKNGVDGKDQPGINPFGAFDGTFTVTTDAAIIANNTDEGPQADPAGQKLTWPVTVRNAAPTALVRLGN